MANSGDRAPTDAGQPVAGPRVVKLKRRWLRYSLRTLLLLVTLFCVWLGIQVDRAHKQQHAVRELRRLGGRVLYDCRPDTDREPSGPAWLRKLIGQDYF